MSEPFALAFVVGGTPGKWARIWGERMPDTPLTLEQCTQDEALDAVRDGRAHVALVRLPVDDLGFSRIPLYDEVAHVVVPKDHVIEAAESVTLADLAGENVLAGDWADAVELVAANVGVAIMPQSVARALSRRDVVARPVEDAASTTIALVWLDGNDSHEVQEFIGIVRGRSANSSRGRQEPDVAEKPERKTVQRKKKVRNVVAGPTPKRKYRKRK